MNTVITFDINGIGRCLYTEAIPLHEIGLLNVQRATRIEFDNTLQVWRVKDKRGIALYTSPSRRTCLQWEHQYFNQDKQHGHRITKDNYPKNNRLI